MSRILNSVHSSAKRLHDADYVNDLTMSEFICLAPTPEFAAKDVVRIRAKNRVSQAMFAALLNVGKTTVAAWEQGTKKPSGAASKLLELVDHKGLDVLMGDAGGISAKDLQGHGMASRRKARHKEFWEPLLKKFAEQKASWSGGGSNNLVLKTPFPDILIKAYASVHGSPTEVFVSATRLEKLDAIEDLIIRDRRYLRRNLPEDTDVIRDPNDWRYDWPIVLRNAERTSPADRQAWLERTLTAFVNVLCPRLKEWWEETRS